MALTVAINSRNVVGNKRQVRATVTFDNSYPTGGESLTAAMLGLQHIDFVEAEVKGGVVAEFDHTNSKIILRSGALAEVANASDQSAVAVSIVATGR